MTKKKTAAAAQTRTSATATGMTNRLTLAGAGTGGAPGGIAGGPHPEAAGCGGAGGPHPEAGGAGGPHPGGAGDGGTGDPQPGGVDGPWPGGGVAGGPQPGCACGRPGFPVGSIRPPLLAAGTRLAEPTDRFRWAARDAWPAPPIGSRNA
ncbi:hypothetical protein GCM10023107_96570 [Actinoplanes octamycinicus]|nr:hypothetical protein Aoc01nite_20820 [Actinoplanes octamycinicus]